MTETETKPIKAAVYVRVSTRDQTTLNQEIALIEYCKKNNYEISKIYKDEGISGAKTSRPYLDVMLDDMRNGLFGAVIVWKLDRLGRSTSHLLQVLEELKNKNVRLVAAAQNIDTDSPQGKFFFIIIGAVAELERDMITERVHLGLDRARKQGKKLGRQKGSKDKNDRKRLGYFERWSKRKAKTPVYQQLGRRL
jgi:DNA invertase Pin-like site-specific DNA recombinase